jgi:hypothetical protein
MPFLLVQFLFKVTPYLFPSWFYEVFVFSGLN